MRFQKLVFLIVGIKKYRSVSGFVPTLLNIEAGQGQVTPPLDDLSGLKTYYIRDN
jgi:hypothetical protein|tara:strand:- start:325 stop:489 length:165 start_codon:yes stop_codon:yes gene_type:complete